MSHRVILSLLALVASFAFGLVLMGLTPVVAAACPQCAGFHKIADGIYVEDDDPALVEDFLRRFEIAEARIAETFGPVARPRMLVCFTQSCHTFMGNLNVRAITYGSHLIYYGPRGLHTEILAHELAHIALHRDLGTRNLTAFPAWVDEGIATWAAKDPNWDLNPRSCTAPKSSLPDTATGWRSAASDPAANLYAKAGCAVAIWFEEHPEAGLDEIIEAFMQTR